LDLTEAGHPLEQRPVAARGGRELGDLQHPAIAVHYCGGVGVEMGVDSAGDWGALYDGHGHPFCVLVVKGWHARPGKETVDDRAAPTGRSITLWNGACRVRSGLVDTHPSLDAHQVRPDRQSLTVAARRASLVDASGAVHGCQYHWQMSAVEDRERGGGFGNVDRLAE